MHLDVRYFFVMDKNKWWSKSTVLSYKQHASGFLYKAAARHCINTHVREDTNSMAVHRIVQDNQNYERVQREKQSSMRLDKSN